MQFSLSPMGTDPPQGLTLSLLCSDHCLFIPLLKPLIYSLSPSLPGVICFTQPRKYDVWERKLKKVAIIDDFNAKYVFHLTGASTDAQ